MKKFKTESKKVLDLMINSIYTHKEIFIRELLSNASDAIDKLYFKTLQDGISGLSRDQFFIKITADKEKKTLQIEDNGIGMTEEELDNNLGIIAKSGSGEFKANMTDENKDQINIIGQFGVGFYSSFMVASKVEVLSKAYGSDTAYKWVSNGSDGYEISKADKDSNGTIITLFLRDDTEDEKYSKFLEEYEIEDLVRKYSDYIKYPIKMDVTKMDTSEDNKDAKEEKEEKTLNSMVPLWKKNKKDITEEEYNKFYKDHFYDYEDPVKVIHYQVEGRVDYTALLYIPAKPAFDYYTKNYEKGLKLYTNGVLITDKCKDLLPDFLNFVRGVVDSDLTLNVSRETIQESAQLKFIASNIEKKVLNELTSMIETDREKYETFFKAFSRQIKYGIYDGWGMNKDKLKDLLMFHSLKEDKLITLKEYVTKMGESQKEIFYASGSSIESIKGMPLTEKILDDGNDILCLVEDIDEFAIKVLNDYQEKPFKSISAYDEKNSEEIDVKNEDLTKAMKEFLGDKVSDVKITNRLKSHAVCLSTIGEISNEMEKVLSQDPSSNGSIKSQKVLEINANHAIYQKLEDMLANDKEKLEKVTKILYNQALLIDGLKIENPTNLLDMICDII
ncbi:MAG: molecular chaperone HtpG [Clostridia bacterium]|nr:molecular chaperone HtpG [Clostridia bacterium]